MMRKLMSLLAIFFPWLVLFIYDNPGGGLIALVMQGSVIGWPLATVWAWRVVHEEKKSETGDARGAKVKSERKQ